MTAGTGSLTRVAVCAVNDLVHGVCAARTPLQVLDTIVGRNSVEMAAFGAGRRLTAEGFEHLAMDEGFTRATVLGEFHNGITHVVQALLEHFTRTAYAAQIARFVEPFKAGNWPPFFEVFPTQNVYGVSMFGHIASLPKWHVRGGER